MLWLYILHKNKYEEHYKCLFEYGNYFHNHVYCNAFSVWGKFIWFTYWKPWRHSSRWAPVLQPKKSRTLSRPVNLILYKNKFKNLIRISKFKVSFQELFWIIVHRGWVKAGIFLDTNLHVYRNLKVSWIAGSNNLTISKGGDLFWDLSNRPIFKFGNTVFILFVIQEFLGLQANLCQFHFTSSFFFLTITSVSFLME